MRTVVFPQVPDNPDGAGDLATSTYTVALLRKLQELCSSEAVLPRLGTIVLLLVVGGNDPIGQGEYVHLQAAAS